MTTSAHGPDVSGADAPPATAQDASRSGDIDIISVFFSVEYVSEKPTNALSCQSPLNRKL